MTPEGLTLLHAYAHSDSKGTGVICVLPKIHEDWIGPKPTQWVGEILGLNAAQLSANNATPLEDAQYDEHVLLRAMNYIAEGRGDGELPRSQLSSGRRRWTRT